MIEFKIGIRKFGSIESIKIVLVICKLIVQSLFLELPDQLLEGEAGGVDDEVGAAAGATLRSQAELVYLEKRH